MSAQSTEIEYTNLGEYLRETRNKLGLDLAAIVDETRISLKNLQAIEESDFSSLPAEAYARGLYTLYAKALSLEPGEILKKYTEEKPKPTKSGNLLVSQGNMAQDVGSLAQRPTAVLFSSLGLAILLLLLFGGFLCWYFSWNPASFLSQKLRGVEGGSQRVEQALKSPRKSKKPEPLFEIVRLPKRSQTTSSLFDVPSTAMADIIQPYTPSLFNPLLTKSTDESLDEVIEKSLDSPPIKSDASLSPLSYKIGESTPWLTNSNLLEPPRATLQNSFVVNRISFESSQAYTTAIPLAIPNRSLQ